MRQPLYLRLRPFLRRDLRARLMSAVAAVFVLTGLCWLGVSALTKIDSYEAHQLRVSLGVEARNAVCGGIDQPACEYEDRKQAAVDREFEHQQRLRLAIVTELQDRIDLSQEHLARAEALTEEARSTAGGMLQGDTVGLRLALTEAVVDLRPALVPGVETRRERLLWPLEVLEHCEESDFDGFGWVRCHEVVNRWRGEHVAGRFTNMRSALLEQIRLEQAMLANLEARVQHLAAREDATLQPSYVDRIDLVADLAPTEAEVSSQYVDRLELGAWLAVRPPAAAMQGWDLFSGESDFDLMSSSVHHAAAASGLTEVHTAVDSLARAHATELHEAVTDPFASIWHGAWDTPQDSLAAIVKPTERYRSPVAASQRWQLIGTGLFVLGGLMLVVVGPVVTATSTAREREAGTLPVLRMTGLSAMDLALAMAIGPNVFALVAGGGLLVLSAFTLGLTAGPVALLMPLAVLLVLSAATHLTAIGLGDALGQRVNALIVGGLLALGLLLPGLVGTTMAVGDMAATGYLLGPLPATLAAGLGLSELPFATWAFSGGSSDLGSSILLYGMAVQVLLGITCLLSWRRRVEQNWAPLFRPVEGVALALASVGCSALAVLDLSERVNVQTYDHVNLLTFVATGFLLPVLGWLLVSSLVRPARAASVASVIEARRAFWRFQAFVLLSATALGFAYHVILHRTGLASESSEVMWATLAQGLLVAETAVATLLWSSRKREGRHRILVLGAAVVLMQLGVTAGIYNLEVEYVALTQSAAHPFLLAMDASPYWLAFLVVLWAAGLGLILAALLRERDRADREAESELADVDEDEDKPTKWLH